MTQTHRKTSLRLEALEDRAVPSTMNVAALATTTIQSQLAAVDAQINSSYSAFATTVFQAEGTFVTSGGSGISALATTVGQAINTLQGKLTTAISGSIGNNALGLIQSQLTGTSPGSLLSGMQELLNAATASAVNGSVPASDFPLLGTAVNEAIGASYTSASVEAYLYATGQGTKAPTNVSLGQYVTRANAAYSSFASTIFDAESFLRTTDGSASPTALSLDVVGVVDSQVGGLVGALGSLVANTSLASRASVIQPQFVGASPASLINQMNSLFGASASPDGSIPQSALPLLNAAVDAAISASYSSSAVEAYILVTY